MICKICNATISDDAQVCPFCNAPVTVDVDPNNAPAPETNAFPDPAANAFPDPAASAPADPVIPDPAPAAAPAETPSPAETPAPSADDLGLSEPAQPYSDPMANQNTQPNQPYMGDPGEIPNGTAVPPNFNQAAQPDYTQNPYSDPSYGGNSYSGPTTDLEKEANTIQTLGIVALIVAIVIGFCCCALAGPGVGIAGLVKFNKIKDSLHLLSPEGQKKANLGKTLSIVAIVLGALGILANIVMMATGAMDGFAEGFAEGLE